MRYRRMIFQYLSKFDELLKNTDVFEMVCVFIAADGYYGVTMQEILKKNRVFSKHEFRHLDAIYKIMSQYFLSQNGTITVSDEVFSSKVYGQVKKEINSFFTPPPLPL